MSEYKRRIVIPALVLVISLFALLATNSSSEFSTPFQTPSETEKEIEDPKVIGAYISLSPVPDSEIERELIDEETKEEQGGTGYRVVKVIDGDTIDVEIEGKIERLRLIGIDTPETVDPRKKVQCYGIEASNKSKEILLNNFVVLESDETQGDRDKYKRLLRYIFLPDGTNFNLFMISEGYAYEYTYQDPYKYQFDFKEAQRVASENQKGLWNPSTCSGVR